MKKMKITALLLALIMLLQPVLVSADAAGVSLKDYMGFINNAQNYGLIDSAYEYYVQQLEGKTVAERYQTLKRWHEGLLGDLFYENFIAYYEKAHAGENLVCVCGAPCEYGNIAHTNPACQWYFGNLPLTEQHDILSGLEGDTKAAYEAVLPADTLDKLNRYNVRTLTAAADDVSVQINVPTGAFAEDYILSASSASLSDEAAAAVAAAVEEGLGSEVLGAFDISFFSVATDDKLQPGAPVGLSFTVDMPAMEDAENAPEVRLVVYHITEKDGALVAEPVGEKAADLTAAQQTVEVEAKAFSMYVVGAVGDTTGTVISSSYFMEVGETIVIYSDNNSGWASWDYSSNGAFTVTPNAQNNNTKYVTVTCNGEGTITLRYGYSIIGFSGDQITITSIPYNVTFDANGGNGNDYVMKVKGSTFVFPNPSDIGITAPEGMEFAGWCVAANGKDDTYSAGLEGSISGNRTFYAQWYDPDAENNTSENEAYFYIRRDGIIPYEPNTSYSSGSYYPTEGNDYHSTNNDGYLRSPVSITNNLTAVKNNLAVSPTLTELDALLGSNTVQVNGEYVQFDPNKHDVVWYAIKYDCSAWYNEQHFHVDGIIVAKNQYIVTYHPNKGSSNVPGGGAYYPDASVTVAFDKIPTRAGYEFLGWDTDENATTPMYTQDGNKTFTMPSKNVDLYAIWRPLNSTPYYVEHYRVTTDGELIDTTTYYRQTEHYGETDSTVTITAANVDDYAINIPGFELDLAYAPAGSTTDLIGKVVAEASDGNEYPLVLKLYYKQSTGNLVISKTVEKAHETDVAEIPADAEFTFTVVFSDTASEFSYTKPDGTKATIKSGGTITLTAGQSVKIEGIKAGTTYTVTETPVAGFAAAAAQSGAITAGADATAAFVNVYQVLKTGSITINKTVVDATFTEGERTFTFTVKYSGSDQGKAQFEEWKATHNGGVVTVTVGTSKTNSVTLSGLPIGSYTVEETPNAAYTTMADGEASYTATASITADALTDSVAFENTRIFMNITVTKVWDDNSNELSERPASVTLTVHASSEVQDQTVVLTAENAVDANTWSKTLTVPKFDSKGQEITYNATEGTVPANYDKNQNKLTVTNSITVGDLFINKTVVDTYGIYSDTDRTFNFKITKDSENVELPVTVEAGKNSGLSQLFNLEPGVYTVVELAKNGYECADSEIEVTVEAGKKASVTFTNTVKTVDIPVTKTWDDLNDKYKVRPASITVTADAEGTKYDKTITISAVDGNVWTGVFENMPLYDANGNKLTYAITETLAANTEFYTIPKIDDVDPTVAAPQIAITNSIKLGSLTITKTVVDPSGKYADDLTFEFTVTGAHYNEKHTVTVKKTDDYTGSVTIPQLLIGDYTVTETVPGNFTVKANGLTATVAEKATATVAFENTVKTVDIPVVKTWDDLNDKYKVRPASITVKLTADKAGFDQEITLNGDANEWTGTFEDVAIYDEAGNKITYAVTETLAANAEFYTIPEIADVDPTADELEIAITNSIKLGSLTITKTVVDPSGKYADDLSFNFTVTGAHYNEAHTVTVKKDNGYTHFVTIPELLIGEYTVTETVPGNFTVTANDLTATVAENATATVAFENTVKTFTLTANKTWVEVNGDKSHRPASVTYTLATGDAQFDDTVTIPAADANIWTVEKANLPVYTEDGTLITYTATETLDEASADFYVLDATSGYDVTATAEDATVSMTNVLKVGNLVIVKVIEDPSATYNASQEFAFTVNGVTKTVTVAAGENTGTTTFENLTIGTYAVTETVPGNYDLTSVTVGNTAIENGGEVAITYDNAPQTTTVTFTNTVKTVDIPVTKIWVDESNKLGTRPDSITLTLTGKVGETAVVTKTQRLTADNAVSGNANQWEFTFEKLPVYTVDGDQITYTVDEAAVKDYEKSINGYVITNTLLSTTLTITKAGCDETLDAGQSFLFRVTSTNGVDLMIAINGNDSETISDLLVGDVVTVTEIEEWSWRYTGAAQTITLVDGTNSVTITNTRDNPYWLDGDCYAENNFAVQGN